MASSSKVKVVQSKDWVGVLSRKLILILFCCHLLSIFAFADVQITDFDDLTFGSWSGSGDLEQSDQLCVYNSASANYKISATSPSGNFKMNDGGNLLSYEVRFQGSSGGFVQLSYNSPTAFTAANTSSQTCGGGTNSTLKVTVTESALSAAAPGSYSGTITLLLEPN